MEAKASCTTDSSRPSNLQAALRWLGVPQAHPLRTLLRLNKDFSLSVVGGTHVEVQLGAVMVAEDLRGCLPKGITLIQRDSSLILVRDGDLHVEPPKPKANVPAQSTLSSLILPPLTGAVAGNSMPRSNAPREKVSKDAYRSSPSGTLKSAPKEKEIEEACKALSWSSGERQALRYAVGKGVTLHLQTFQRAKETGMLELQGLENLDHRELLRQLGFSPSSQSPWCATWKKRLSSGDDEWQTARVTLGVKPVIQISFL